MVNCEFCGKAYNTTQGLGNHKKHCKLNSNKIIDVNPSFCKFCNKECKNNNSLINHEKRCKLNLNRIIINDTFKIYRETFGSWNKGLTKDTDIRIANYVNTFKQHLDEGLIIPSFKGKHLSDLHKQHISEGQLKADHSNKDRFSHGRKGWFDGIFFMSTYELAYYIYMKDTGHTISRCKQRFQYVYKDKIHYYTPDFIVDNNYLVETKGYERDVDLYKYKAVDNLKVFYKNDIIHMIEYVKNKYNITDISLLYTSKDGD